jgi:hypothetical protein
MALRGGAATAAKLECGVVGVLCPVKPVEIDQSVGDSVRLLWLCKSKIGREVCLEEWNRR